MLKNSLTGGVIAVSFLLSACNPPGDKPTNEEPGNETPVVDEPIVEPTVFKQVFPANNGANGMELWVTDGTAEGTVMLKDIFPGTESSELYDFEVVGDESYFLALDAEDSPKVWKTDSTAEGTVVVADDLSAFETSTINEIAVASDRVFFVAREQGGSNRDIWQTTGDTPTLAALGSYPYGLTVLGDKLFFNDWDVASGRELWRYDGESSIRFMDIYPGTTSGSLSFLQIVDDTLFFSGITDVNPGRTLWKTDGTDAGTEQVMTQLNSLNSFTFEDTLYLVGQEVGNTDAYKIWKYAEGGFTFSTFTPPSGYSIERLYAAADESLYSIVESYTFREIGMGLKRFNAYQLRKTVNGQTTDPINLPGRTGAYIAFGGLLIFETYTDGNGWELWRSDGTDVGTFRLADINQLDGDSSEVSFDVTGQFNQPARITGNSDQPLLMFKGVDPTYGAELWVTDGTVSGTRMVKDINPNSASGLTPPFRER